MSACRVAHLSAALAVGAIFLASCAGAPGRPGQSAAPPAAAEFDALYASNCAGCHGANGSGGAALALANPVYLHLVTESTLRTVIGNGVPGTAMPAFARSSGGMLTDRQVDVIVGEMVARWGRPDAVAGDMPPYARTSAGDAQRGELAYRTFCESCHGAGGRGGPKGSAITDDSFLALVSDQGLRTIVITGRPELGAPDWRANVPGTPMSDQQVTDVVAWLASHRVASPGQPYVTEK